MIFIRGELAFADKNQLEDYQNCLQELIQGLGNLAKKNNIVLLVITEVLVLLLYRKEDNTDEDSTDVIEDLGLTIAKNKRGELGEIPIKRNNYTGEYFFCEK